MLALKGSQVRQHSACGAAQDEPRRTSTAAPAGYMSAPTFLFVGGYTLGEAYGTANYEAVLQRSRSTVMNTGLAHTLGTEHR